MCDIYQYVSLCGGAKIDKSFPLRKFFLLFLPFINSHLVDITPFLYLCTKLTPPNMNIFDILISATPRIGDNATKTLIEKFGSAEAIFNAPRARLTEKEGLSPAAIDEILKRHEMPLAEHEIAYCNSHNITPIAATDHLYPTLLRDIHNPPHVIYTLGDTQILNHNLISIIGSRNVTHYGERACHKIVEQLAAKVDNLVIVSGLAHGVDSAAHRAALDIGIPTIAVLPAPLPRITPSTNTHLARNILEQGGLLLSELRSTTRIAKYLYLQRNRIITGLSQATLVVESKVAGGSMKSVAIAESQGRTILALPGRITDEMSEGCNDIIARQVASSITSGDDIVRLLGWEERCRYDASSPSSSQPLDDAMLNEVQRALLAHLPQGEGISLAQLGELSGLSIVELKATIVELEIYGFVVQVDAMHYERGV